MRTKKIHLVLWGVGLLIFFIILCGCVLFMTRRRIKEGFTREIDKSMFVNQEEFDRVVLNSPFFDILTPWDLRVRGHNGDASSYRIKYMKSRMDFTPKWFSELSSLVKKVDQEMGVGASVLGRIPWKFVVFDSVDGAIEGGLCHTIGDIIMFPSDFFGYSMNRKIRLLIHEKVHVYQRMDPVWASDIIQKWGMTAMGEHGSLGWMEDIRRHNPDLDLFDYGFSGVGRLVELYTGDKSLLDSSTFLVKDNGEQVFVSSASEIDMPPYIGQIEHPYEIMACMIPVLVMEGGQGGDFKNQEQVVWDALWG